jgi:hypothetical protein
VDVETQAQERNFHLADGFHRLITQSNSFALLLRYQAQAERQYRRAIEEFDRLKALREELPNEPILAEPETIETTSPSCETNPIPPGDPTPAPAPAFQPLAPIRQPPVPALDYHVEVPAPIPGGPPCIER